VVAMIDCRQVSRVFNAGGQPFHALRNVSLQIDEGELVAVVGASGSGKSTLLNIIGALDIPDDGELHINGQPLGLMTEPQLAALRNGLIGFVFQQFNLLTRYDAVRNVELPLVYAGLPGAQRRERAMSLLAQLGLAEHARKRPPQMSGGQQQRVALARALANRPRLILADEPTGALDSRTSAEVMDLLVGLHRQQGITVVIVTHDLAVASRCDRVIRFADGAVVSDERAAAVGA
jgi:putative ABC transport system ATP-binding protein